MARPTQPPFSRGRSEIVFRGSKRRLRRVRLADHLGWGALLFLLWIVIIAVVLIPWIGSCLHHGS